MSAATRPSYALTDIGNGERFAADHGAVARHVGAWKRWLVWDGSRWLLDDNARVMQFAKQTAKSIVQDAVAATDSGVREAITKHWLASQSRSRLDAMIALAASEEPIPISHESLDGDAWILNCQNGTIDLRTGELMPHDPGRLCTLTTSVEYPDGPGVDAPLWAEFLNRVFDANQELIRFVQRLVGVSLIGEQREHLLPVFHGGGANGKSVFIGAIQHAMGEYATMAAPGLLMASRSDRHPCELAALFRKRLVVVSETKDSQKLDEGLVKSITGGDSITARRMREDFWTFPPSHLALVVTNHKPVVDGVDHGLWRRLRLVPFTVTIPPEERDNTLPEKLQREAPAILRWAVEGCLAWQREGLGEPDVVLAATHDYQADSDVLGRWIADDCFVSAAGSMRAAVGYERYQKWCLREGEAALNMRRFGERMKEKFTNKKDRRGRFYEGISLACDGSSY